MVEVRVRDEQRAALGDARVGTDKREGGAGVVQMHSTPASASMATVRLV